MPTDLDRPTQESRSVNELRTSRPGPGGAVVAGVSGRRRVVAAVTALVAIASPGIAATASSDVRPGRTDRVNVTSSGAQAHYSNLPGDNCAGWGDYGDVSSDGRYVTFFNNADNLVPGDTNQTCDVFWRDRVRGITRRVNVSSAGAQTTGKPLFKSVPPVSISGDGRYVTFNSNDPGWAPGQLYPNAGRGYVRDVVRGTSSWVTKSFSGGELKYGIFGGSANIEQISRNGRYVVFTAYADNVIEGLQYEKDALGNPQLAQQIYRRDLRTGTNVLVSAAMGSPRKPGDYNSTTASISADGRYVAFTSEARNLVPTSGYYAICNCRVPDVFVRDVLLGTTTRVSVASDGTPASYGLFPSCTIAPGSPVTLPNGLPVTLPEARYVPCSSMLEVPGGRAISDDGRFVTFSSNATNLVPNDTNFSPTGEKDRFVHDMRTRRTERISVDSYAHETTETVLNTGSLSGDGRIATYDLRGMKPSPKRCNVSPAPGVEPPSELTVVLTLLTGACDRIETYAMDRLTGQVDWLSPAPGGRPSEIGGCETGSIPAATGSRTTALDYHGRHALVWSSASELVPGDTNDRCDWFVRDRGAALGVGGATGAGASASQSGSAHAGVLERLDKVDGLTSGDLVGARIAARPSLRDLYVRWDVVSLSGARVPTVLAGGTVLYGLTFTSGDVRYQVRADALPGADWDPLGGGSFGLYRQDSRTGLFSRVTSLKGGYGTVGESVVTTIPFSAVDATGLGELNDLEAFTAIGNVTTGATRVLDTIRLAQ